MHAMDEGLAPQPGAGRCVYPTVRIDQADLARASDILANFIQRTRTTPSGRIGKLICASVRDLAVADFGSNARPNPLSWLAYPSSADIGRIITVHSQVHIIPLDLHKLLTI